MPTVITNTRRVGLGSPLALIVLGELRIARG